MRVRRWLLASAGNAGRSAGAALIRALADYSEWIIIDSEHLSRLLWSGEQLRRWVAARVCLLLDARPACRLPLTASTLWNGSQFLSLKQTGHAT